MPTPKTLQFEQATVIYSEEHSEATGKVMPKLYVQCIDSYRYQREWTLQFRHVPGDSKRLIWESHAYKHRGIRNIVEIPAARATNIIERFLSLCSEYPTLLFNANGDNDRARAEGFVHFHDRLLAGEELRVGMLT